MYYVIKSIKDAKIIHKRHPNILLEDIELKIKYALDTIRARYNDEPTVCVLDNSVEYCYLDFFKRNERLYGKQGKLSQTIKY